MTCQVKNSYLVVAELEGLSLENNRTESNGVAVHSNAKTALIFLKQTFASKPKSTLFALSNQGSPLDSVTFTNQGVYCKVRFQQIWEVYYAQLRSFLHYV